MTDPAEIVAVDTSVSVPLLVESHPDHVRVRAALDNRLPCLTGQSVVETYAVLTRLPGDARLAPGDAARLLDLVFGEPLLLPAKRRTGVHHRLSQLGIAGGAAYDGLIGMEARAHERTLVSRDRRAAATYALVGVSVELIPASL